MQHFKEKKNVCKMPAPSWRNAKRYQQMFELFMDEASNSIYVVADTAALKCETRSQF